MLHAGSGETCRKILESIDDPREPCAVVSDSEDSHAVEIEIRAPRSFLPGPDRNVPLLVCDVQEAQKSLLSQIPHPRPGPMPQKLLVIAFDREYGNVRISEPPQAEGGHVERLGVDRLLLEKIPCDKDEIHFRIGRIVDGVRERAGEVLRTFGYAVLLLSQVDVCEMDEPESNRNTPCESFGPSSFR